MRFLGRKKNSEADDGYSDGDDDQKLDGLQALLGIDREVLQELFTDFLSDFEGFGRARSLEEVMHTDDELKHQLGLRLAFHLHEKGIKCVFFLDSASRLGATYLRAAWPELFPNEDCPKVFFTNPAGYQTEEHLKDLISHEVGTGNTIMEIRVPRYANQYMKQNEIANGTFNELIHNTVMGFVISSGGKVEPENLRRAIQFSLDNFYQTLWPKFIETFGVPRSQEEVTEEFLRTYKTVANDPSMKVAVVDTCSHTGSTIDPVLDAFAAMNMARPHFVTVSNQRNFGETQPDFYLFGQADCYAFEPKRMTRHVTKTIKSVLSSVAPRINGAGRALPRLITDRGEVARNLRESLRFDLGPTTLWQKVKENQAEEMHMLVVDMDGTVYIRRPDGVMEVGPNNQTAVAMRERGIPLVVNTSRPEWTDDDDAQFELMYDLPQPDVVVANHGSVIYWRDDKGKLVVDLPYARQYYARRLTAVDGEGKIFHEDWSPEGIARFIVSEVNDKISNTVERCLREVSVDDCTDTNPGSIRFIIDKMPYQDLDEFVNQIHQAVGGLEVGRSEASYMNQEAGFTGWLHITPGVHKGTGLKHILQVVHREMKKNKLNTSIKVHVVGDSSNDLSMMQKELSPSPAIEVSGYLVANATQQVKRDAYQNHPGITILGDAGPYALNAIVQYID